MAWEGWRSSYEKLSDPKRIVEVFDDVECREGPIGRGYLIERETTQKNLTRGANNNAQLWRICVIHRFEPDEGLRNADIGVRFSKKWRWINNEDLPQSLRDTESQIDLFAKGRFEQSGDDRAQAAAEAGVEVDAAAKHKAALEKEKAERIKKDLQAQRRRESKSTGSKSPKKTAGKGRKAKQPAGRTRVPTGNGTATVN